MRAKAALRPRRRFVGRLLERSLYEFIATAGSLPVFSALVVYLSMLSDNILRSIIVPLLPDLVASAEGDPSSGENATSSSPMAAAKTERSAVLLASKPVVQLAANSFVAAFVQKVGCQLALLAGNVVLAITAVAFAFGNAFDTLMAARGLHGIASTVITVSGMTLCARKLSGDRRFRSQLMGVLMGSDAAGVLAAYTVGVFAFNACGQFVVFAAIALLILANAALLLVHIRSNQSLEEADSTSWAATANRDRWYRLIADSTVSLVSVALFVSTSTIAILEPCLPIWIKRNMTLKKWQSELVFLPDSLGYLISTCVSPAIAYRVGKWRTVTLAAWLIGGCSILIPSSSTLVQLSVPHFCVGFGIGAVDSTAMPMLADVVDLERGTRYSSMYALQQAVTSLAYVFGYSFTAELVRLIGFPRLLVGIGVINVAYGVLVLAAEFTFLEKSGRSESRDYRSRIELTTSKPFDYSAFENSADDD